MADTGRSPYVISIALHGAVIAALVWANVGDQPQNETGDMTPRGAVSGFGGLMYSPQCTLGNAPQILETSGDAHSKGGRLAQVWEVNTSEAFWRPEAPVAGSYAAFAISLRASGTDTNPVSLLQRKSALPQTSPGDASNNALVASEASRWIRPINCLEMILVGIQNDRIGLLTQSTEFTAFVMQSVDAKRLRIYYYTRNEDGIGNVGPVLTPVDRDYRSGWILLGNLHNHNFRLGETDLNAVVSPSLPDAQLYQSLAAKYQMREAWITNGLHTARIPATAFGRLQAAQ